MEVYKSGIPAGRVNMSSAPHRRGNDQFDRRQDNSFGLPEGSCAGPSRPRGHSPDYVKLNIRRQTTTLSDANNSSSSSSPPRHQRPRYRKTRKARKSSDEFLSFRETSHNSGSQSTGQRTFLSYKPVSDSSTRPSHRKQPAVTSKSVEIPLITVQRTETRRRGTRRRSRSIETRIRVEVPPPADDQQAPCRKSQRQQHIVRDPCCSSERQRAAQSPCRISQQQRVAQAPCYPTEPVAYHPSCCDDSITSESSKNSKSCTSKAPKKISLYNPERVDSSDHTRPECWTGVSKRLLEDQRCRPPPPPCACQKESTLNVSITTNMEGSKPHPNRRRRSSADHHERALNHLGLLSRKHNPMDESTTDLGRNERDGGFGQRHEVLDDNPDLLARNRFRRESLKPPESDDEDERESPKGPDADPEQPTVRPTTQPPSAKPSRKPTEQDLERRPSPPQPSVAPRPPPRSFDSGVQPTVSDYNIRLTEESTEDGQELHTFPFQETPSGYVKFEKRLVSFENPKIAVLVANPEKTRVNIKQDRHGPPPTCRVPEPIPEPEPEAICKPPVIWDEPRFRDQPDEDACTSSCQKSNSAPLDRGTCAIPSPKPACVIPSPKPACAIPSPKSLSGSGGGCYPTSCRARSKSTDGSRRQSLAYSNESTRASRCFMENIHHRLKTAHNADTIIRIGQCQFPCHALALECYSKHFDRLKRPKDAIMEVELPECAVSAKCFTNLMDWILIDDKNKLLVIDRDNAVNLFAAAVYLGIPDLRKDCLDFVKMKVESCDPSIMKMYGEAREKEHCEELIALLAQKLSTLFPQIYKTKQFLHMDVKELTMILSADNIVIKSEIDVYDAAVRWLLYDWQRRNRYAVPVMSSVRFGLLSSLQLTQIKHPGTNDQLPSYAELLDNSHVNKLIEDGLTFAILRENYKGRSGELNLWVNKTGIEPPRFRHNLSLEPDDNRLPAAVTFESDRESTSDPGRRTSLKPRDREPSPKPPPRRHRTSISEDVTLKSTKILGENNVGVSRFSKAHSNDFQEEDSKPQHTMRRSSWRDPENSTVDSNAEPSRGQGPAEDVSRSRSRSRSARNSIF